MQPLASSARAATPAAARNLVDRFGEGRFMFSRPPAKSGRLQITS
jgi:hypothetical protein